METWYRVRMEGEQPVLEAPDGTPVDEAAHKAIMERLFMSWLPKMGTLYRWADDETRRRSRIGHRIRTLREERKWSPADLVRAIDCDCEEENIDDFESGKSYNGHNDPEDLESYEWVILDAIAATFSLSTEELVGG